MNKILPPIAIIIAAILWSLDGLLRQELYALPSMLIVALEHAIGAILLCPLIVNAWKDIKSLNQRDWVSIIWVSICGGLLGTFFYTKALSYINYIDLSVVVLLQKLQPLFAISLAAIILKEKLSKKFILLSCIAMIGGYFVTFGTTPISEWDDKTTIAALLATLAAFSWGSSTVLGKHALKKLAFPTVTALRLTITSLVALIIYTYTNKSTIEINISYYQWRSLLLIVLSSGSLALFIYYYGLKYLPASHTSLYELTWPLSAVFLDWIIRGRFLTISQFIGASLLLGSMFFLSKEKINE